jgi:hypothetical protein
LGYGFHGAFPATAANHARRWPAFLLASSPTVQTFRAVLHSEFPVKIREALDSQKAS